MNQPVTLSQLVAGASAEIEIARVREDMEAEAKAENKLAALRVLCDHPATSEITPNQHLCLVCGALF